MRSIATALEAYQVDENKYPPDENWIQLNLSPVPPIQLRAVAALSKLTTPVAYMTSIPKNPFPNKTDDQDLDSYFRYFGKEWKEYLLLSHPTWPNTAKLWSLASCGPNHISNAGEYLLFGEEVLNSIPGVPALDWGAGCLYDPSNGTVSEGDIVRVGP
jgi:hypothetical protein